MSKDLAFAEPQAKAKTIFDNLDVSETTRKDYSARIGLFLSYVDSRGFNRESILSFKRYLGGRSDYSISTKNKYLITARVFIKELVRLRIMPLDVPLTVRQFRQSKRHRRQGLTDSEVQMLGIKLKYFPKTQRNSRLRALFALLAFQGLRQIEIVRLDVEDINLVRKTALIHGKGEDDKEIIYLAPATVQALKDYLSINKLESGTLFRSMGNRKTERMSTMTIKRELGKLMRGIGIEKGVHGFRHFYVTELLKCMGVGDVRKFSRHRSLETVIVYDDEVNLERKAKQVFDVLERFRTTF